MSGEALREVFARFGFEVDASPLSGLTQIVTSAKGRIAVLGAGLLAGAEAARQFATAFAADSEALRETADATRLTTEQVQELAFAGRAAGVSAGALSSGVNTLGAGLRAIEARSGGPTNALWRLGVRARNVDGTMRDTSSVLLDVADRLERVRSPVVRLRLAQELFGSSGRRMLDVLRGGSAALRRQREDFAALGGGVLPEAVEAGRQYTMAQQRMRVATDSIRSVLAVGLLPVMARTTNLVANVVGWFSRMARGSQLVEGALVALRISAVAAIGRILIALAPMLLPMAKAVLVALALAFAWDEVSTFIKGGDSLLGRFLDKMGGVGTAASAAQALRDAWDGVKLAVRDVGGAVTELKGVYNDIAGPVTGALNWLVTKHNEAARSVYQAHVDAFRTAYAELEPIARPVVDAIAELARGVWSSLSGEVRAFFSGIADRIARLARATGLTALAERVQAAAAPTVDAARQGLRTAGEAVSGVARGAQGEVNNARTSVDHAMRATSFGRLESLVLDTLTPGALMGEWSNLLGSRPTTTAAPRTSAVTNNNQVTLAPGSVVVNGARDTNAVADEVMRRLPEAMRRQRDAQHPQDAED